MSLAGLLGSYGKPEPRQPAVESAKKPEGESDQSNEKTSIQETSSPKVEEIKVEYIHNTASESDFIKTALDWLGNDTPGQPDPKLVASLEKMHHLRESGKTVNDKLNNTKAFANPNLFEKLVVYFGINETGTNCPNHLFTLEDFVVEDFIDSISEEIKQREERRIQEQKNRTEIAFTNAATTVNRRSVAGVPVTRMLSQPTRKNY